MRLVAGLVILALPLLELALLIRFGQAAGVGPTLALVVVTGIAGALVVRHQGTAAIRRIGDAVEKGGDAMRPVIESVLVFAAGVMLILPGLVTDALGLLLLIPPLRRLAASFLATRLATGADVHVEVWEHRESARRGPSPPVIEGEFERIEDDESPPKDRPSPWRK